MSLSRCEGCVHKSSERARGLGVTMEAAMIFAKKFGESNHELYSSSRYYYFFFILETRQLTFIKDKHVSQGHTLLQKRVIYLYELYCKYKTQNQVKIILKDKKIIVIYLLPVKERVQVYHIKEIERKRELSQPQREIFISKKGRFRFWEATRGNQLFQIELNLMAMGHDKNVPELCKQPHAG